MSEREQLLPCPFCGAQLERRTFADAPGLVRYEHPLLPKERRMDCLFAAIGYRAPLAIFEDEIAAWNRRPDGWRPEQVRMNPEESAAVDRAFENSVEVVGVMPLTSPPKE